MDKLQAIIHCMDKDEQKAFIHFAQRLRQDKKRKDLKLFQLLAQDTSWKSQDLQHKLYSTSRAAAYHALRKRLMDEVANFLVLRRWQRQDSAEAQAMGWLSLAQFLLENQQEKLAWEMLRKAENQAQKQEQFELLNSIYLLQLAQAESEFAPPLATILEAQEANKKLAMEEERATIAMSKVRRALVEVQVAGFEEGFEDKIKAMLSEYQLTDAVARRPKLFSQLMSMIRAAVKVQKDYHVFAPYLLGQYEFLLSQGAFLPHHLPYQLELLYMIAHVLYRSKRFEHSTTYVQQAEELMAAGPISLRKQFRARFSLQKAANYAYQGELQQAIDLLENLLKQSLDVKPFHNACISLSYYYFLKGEIKEALRISLKVRHADRWLIKKMGREWVLKKSTSEIILQYALGHEELAYNKLKATQRNFSDLMQLPMYANVSVYIKLLEDMIRFPEEVGSDAFLKKIEEKITFSPYEEEDLIAMSFYAWLKAKVLKRDFYEVLLELVA